GYGTFIGAIEEPTASALPGWFEPLAATANIARVVGDFDGDGMDDVALLGGANWGAIPVTYSHGKGRFASFYSTLSGYTQFTIDAANLASAGTLPQSVLVGDFNGDGMADIALVGSSSFTGIPVAISNGNGTFTAYNSLITYAGGYSGFPADAA